MSSQAARKTKSSRRALTPVLLTLIALLVVCAIGAIFWAASSVSRREGTVTLRVAYSPEKEAIFTSLLSAFNGTRPRLADRRALVVEGVKLTPKEMIAAAQGDTLHAVSPDSSIWLGEMDRVWRQTRGADATLVGETARYMVSPVVIAMWREVAERLGYPERNLGWADLLRAATQDPTFGWSHPSTDTASGLLATLATFYAATGRTRDLTEELALDEATLSYVATLEKTVRHYGEGEAAVMERVRQQGRAYLDAFVVQEQMVVAYNQEQAEDLVAIYPVEGTLWEDHPLALLEHPGRTDAEREGFRLLRDYLLSSDTQLKVLRAGYRPSNLTIPLDGPDSPITAANGADPGQPYTTLQIPSPGVIRVVRDAWLYSKRHANIYLVVDISGSMRGQKLTDAKVALHAFVDQMQGDMERVGLITFATDVREVVPLTQLGEGRARLHEEIDRLEAGGNTALLDGVDMAFVKLTDLGDTERINAIVVMTDGIENRSAITSRSLATKLTRAMQGGMPVLTFCIAYGADADYAVLAELSTAGGGFTERGELETIKRLYETLSTYF